MGEVDVSGVETVASAVGAVVSVSGVRVEVVEPAVGSVISGSLISISESKVPIVVSVSAVGDVVAISLSVSGVGGIVAISLSVSVVVVTGVSVSRSSTTMIELVSVDVGVSDSISSLWLAISSGEGLANKEPTKVANMMATKATNEVVLTAGESSDVPIDFTGDK